MAREPFLGVPKGNVRVENPDGVYLRGPQLHNLYDGGALNQPIIPGDFDRERMAQKTEPDPKV